MKNRTVPHFIIKDPMNKTSITGRVFRDEVTEAVLRDVCLRITRQVRYRPGLDTDHLAWVRDSVTTDKLPKDVLTPGFLDYLRRRNKTS